MRISTGVSGLDEVTRGGFLPGRVYMVRGRPGTGKTTLGFHFLTAWQKENGRGLYVTFEHTSPSVISDAEDFGFDLNKLEILDLSEKTQLFTESKGYDTFPTSEIEVPAITRALIECLDKVKPSRVFIDALTQLQILFADAAQVRRQVSALFRLLRERQITVLFSSESSMLHPDDELQFASDGIINLENTLELGRSLHITKTLGSEYLDGRHGMRITQDGLCVFPRLVPSEHRTEFKPEMLGSGVKELDQLLHGGVTRGTVSLITGPSGVGKTTLGLQFMAAAAGRGENSLVCLFDEAKDTMLARANQLSIPVTKMLDMGKLQLLEVEPLLYSADEFTSILRKHVEENAVKTILIDSLEGFRLSLRGENFIKSIRALWRFLTNMGVTLFVTSEVENIAGEFRATEQGISYLADDIIFFRYIEHDGELRRAIGVLKKRMGDFEKTLREIRFTSNGIQIDEPLRDISGILRGIPSKRTSYPVAA